MEAPAITEIPESGLALGKAWSREKGQGVNIAEAGYREDEYFFTTTATEWTHDQQWVRQPVAKHEVTTRVLVRRPMNVEQFSGVVSLEPLHPNLDRANSWRHSSGWIMSSGHVWVGVTQEKTMGDYISSYFPDRYASLRLPVAGLGYDLLGQVAGQLHAGRFGFEVDHVILSGWSATGSFSRVYLQEGFLGDHLLPDGRPSVNGVLIGISSGAAGRAGYPALSESSPLLPLDHPRRTIAPSPVPVFEVLSEYEAETHFPVLRDDSDAPGDRYRLYQVAGTSHANLDISSITNEDQFRDAGLEVPRRRISEVPSDSSFSPVAAALYEALLQWIVHDTAPPAGRRFAPASKDLEGPANVELERNSYGNVVGGVRTAWVEVPLATYMPHSTPAEDFVSVGAWTPHSDSTRSARLVGHMVPFSPERVSALYVDGGDYTARFVQAVDEMVENRWLLPRDADELKDSASRRWNAAQ